MDPELPLIPKPGSTTGLYLPSRMSLSCPKLTQIYHLDIAPYPAFSRNKYWLKTPTQNLKSFRFCGCRPPIKRNVGHLRTCKDTLPVMTGEHNAEQQINHTLENSHPSPIWIIAFLIYLYNLAQRKEMSLLTKRGMQYEQL